MNKLFLITTTVALAIFSFKTTCAYWSDGGTLHKSSVGEWKRATYKNKLATSADLVLLSKMVERRVRDSGKFDTLKIYAQQLVICIDEASDVPGNEHHKLSSLSAPCMLTMGWLEEN